MNEYTETAIAFEIRRPDYYLRAEALRTGQNQPTVERVTVPVTSLPDDLRPALLERGNSIGTYPHYYDGVRVQLDKQAARCKITAHGSHKTFALYSDAPTITPGHVVDAIRDAIHRADLYCQDYNESAQKCARQWATIPVENRTTPNGPAFCRPYNSNNDYSGPLTATGIHAFDPDAVRAYEPAALAESVRYQLALQAKKEAEATQADLRLVSSILAYVKNEAILTAIDAYANDRGLSPAQVRADTERASTHVLFDDENDDDNDD